MDRPPVHELSAVNGHNLRFNYRSTPGSSRKASANLAREGRFGYLLVESTGISEPLPAAGPRLGRRTVLTFPLLPPPQKN
jgi:hypothetical protein